MQNIPIFVNLISVYSIDRTNDFIIKQFEVFATLFILRNLH